MKKLLLSLVVVGVVLVGGAYWLHRPRTVAMSEGLFTYTPVEYGSLRDTVGAKGVLKPQDILLVTSELPGTVVEILKKVNDEVSEGDVVVRLDDTPLRLKVQEAVDAIGAANNGVELAREQVENAKFILKQKQELADKGGFRSEVKEADANVRKAELMVKLADLKVQQAQTGKKEAERALAKMQVRVPELPSPDRSHAKRRYIVLDSKVQRGQVIGPTLPQPLFTLAADLSRMEVHAEVQESDIGKVHAGMEATFTVSAYAESEVRFQGKVRQVNPLPAGLQGLVFYETIIENVRNQVDPATKQWRLRPGMSASVELIRREHANVWKIPVAALSFQMDEAYQSDAARAHVAEWSRRPDQAEWRPVWIWDSQRGEPWPIFVKIGEDGIADGQFNEVLAWEQGREPSRIGQPLRLIVNAPPPHRPGLFEQPTNLKL